MARKSDYYTNFIYVELMYVNLKKLKVALIKGDLNSKNTIIKREINNLTQTPRMQSDQ